MLPFLKRKDQGSAGLIIKNRTPDEKPEQEDDKDAAIHACAQDLIDSIHNRDVKGAAEAIRSAFDILESLPHEEGPHEGPEPHSYESQNQKAGQ